MAAQTKKPHVLIAGAGLGGLALAQALRKQGISYEIFERSDVGRAQGYAIGIHSILDDLAASFPDDMPSIKVNDHFLPLSLSAELIFYPADAIAPRIGVRDTGDRTLIRCNRQRLRNWLATNLDIQYGKIAASVDQGPDSVTLHFRDGTSATGDILVGADGAHSAIRRSILSQVGRQDPLQHLPLVMIVGETTLEGEYMERQLELGHSCYIAGFREGGSLFVGLNSVAEDGNSGRYYWSVVYHDEAARQLPHWTASAPKADLLKFSKEKIQHLHPRFREIVEKTDVEGIVSPALTFQDLELEDMPVSRVTLLGDAAHCMTPFRGEGGIHAMRDSLNLARTISKIVEQGSDLKSIEHGFAEYQAEMLERGIKSVRLSRDAGSGSTQSKTSDGPRYVWGRPAGEVPEETLSLQKIPRVQVS